MENLEYVNHYKLLGVSRDAGDTEIKKAYKQKTLMWHPDKNRNKGEVELMKAERKMRSINEAMETLNSPLDKAWYDM